jgi:hypothetical protein
MSDDTSQEQSKVALQLEDLVRTLEIINLASSRGAFKPEEFTLIGEVYNRMFAFLQASGAIQQPQPTEADITKS